MSNVNNNSIFLLNDTPDSARIQLELINKNCSGFIIVFSYSDYHGFISYIYTNFYKYNTIEIGKSAGEKIMKKIE